MNQLDPSVKLVWGAALLWKTIFFAGLLLGYELWFSARGNNIFVEWLGVTTGFCSVILALAGLCATVVVPMLRYKFWRFEVQNDEIHIIRGIITRRHTVAPVHRIQHLDTTQNLWERMFEVSRLVLYTAGTRGADVVIPGLPPDYAEELRDALKQQLHDELGAI